MPRYKVIVAMEFIGEIEASDLANAEFHADQWDADIARSFELFNGPTVMEIEEIKSDQS